MLDPNSCVCTHPRQYCRQEWINSIKRASSPRVPSQGTGNCQGISALTHCHSWASQQPASDTVTALATSAHWVLSLLEIKIILTPLCSCADSGVQKHSHMYWNLCCGYEDLGVYLHATNLTNFIPFEVWWLLQSRHVEQSVRKSCGRQMSAFPSVPYGPCRVPAGMITWSMAWVSPGAPLPLWQAGLTGFSPCCFTTKLSWPFSLWVSYLSSTAICPIPQKHRDIYSCALQKQLSLFIQLSPCVKMRNWIIHCMSQTLMTKLGFASLSSRQEGKWRLRQGKSLTERGHAVSLCSTAGSPVDAIITHQ